MAHGRRDCDGYVRSIRDQLVLCTGKIYVDGERMQHADLRKAIRGRGGWTVEGTRNANVTTRVVGDLPVTVTDPVSRRTTNLVYAEAQRARGNHVCIVDHSGVSALLRGDDAPCLRSRAVRLGVIEVSLPATWEPGPHLVPLNLAKAPSHDEIDLELDLSGLDAGKAAHQGTLALVIALLAPTVAQTLNTPRVDAAWRSRTDPGVLVIAEVKSLTGTHESQQIRLGIGQVLDYAVTLRARPPEGVEMIRPVLVLEKEPDGLERWEVVAATAGIDLVWAPAFRGLPR